jgi:hypothetical protein
MQLLKEFLQTKGWKSTGAAGTTFVTKKPK